MEQGADEENILKQGAWREEKGLFQGTGSLDLSGRTSYAYKIYCIVLFCQKWLI